MRPSDIRALHDVTNEILAKLQAMPSTEMYAQLNMQDDCGVLPPGFFSESCSRHTLSLGEVSAAIVRGKFVLRHELHAHKKSCLHATCLGPRENFPPAVSAQVLFSNEWFPFRSTDSILFHPNANHSFIVGETGSLYYLSVLLRVS